MTSDASNKSCDPVTSAAAWSLNSSLKYALSTAKTMLGYDPSSRRQCHFLRLPPEIRVQVYEAVRDTNTGPTSRYTHLVSKSEKLMWKIEMQGRPTITRPAKQHEQDFDLGPTSLQPFINLARTCRIVRQECATIALPKPQRSVALRMDDPAIPWLSKGLSPWSHLNEYLPRPVLSTQHLILEYVVPSWQGTKRDADCGAVWWFLLLLLVRCSAHDRHSLRIRLLQSRNGPPARLTQWDRRHMTKIFVRTFKELSQCSVDISAEPDADAGGALQEFVEFMQGLRIATSLIPRAAFGIPHDLQDALRELGYETSFP